MSISQHRPQTTILVAVLLLAMTAVLQGCAQHGSGVRNLRPSEAERLIYLHGASEGDSGQANAPGGDAPPKWGAKELEAHGDTLAQRQETSAALFQYHRAMLMAKGEDKDRVTLKAAQICLKDKKFHQARQLFERVVKKDPDQVLALQGLGLSLLSLARLEESQAALQKAVGLKPELWRAQNALGVIANRQERPQQALMAFAKALKIMPDQPAILNNMAVSHMILGHLDQAEVLLKKSLMIDKEYSLAFNNLAVVLARLGRHREALVVFSRSQGMAKALNNIGCLLHWDGSNRQAAKHFASAMEAMPRYYPLAFRHLQTVESLEKSPVSR